MAHIAGKPHLLKKSNWPLLPLPNDYKCFHHVYASINWSRKSLYSSTSHRILAYTQCTHIHQVSSDFRHSQTNAWSLLKWKLLKSSKMVSIKSTKKTFHETWKLYVICVSMCHWNYQHFIDNRHSTATNICTNHYRCKIRLCINTLILYCGN